MSLAEPFDLGAQVLLGVEPGSGDVSLTATAFEGDPLTGGVHAAQRGDGALAGVLSPALGGLDDMVRVVSPHRRPSAFSSGDLADHPVEVGEDPLVHLRHALLALAGGDLDEGERAMPLLAQFGRNSGPDRNIGQVRPR